MRKDLLSLAIGAALAVFALAARAAELENAQTMIGKAGIYVLVLIAIVVGVYVYFMRWRDRRAAPLSRIYEQGGVIHSVQPSAFVTECVQKMAREKIGALMVMEADRLQGIFTERDALNKVLAVGLDPRGTRVSEVMTKEPISVPPTMTVGAAMQLVTSRRFRHLPVVQEGRVLGVVSSGDLTHWLVKNQLGEIEELLNLAARS
jgi:predicted transcriptional regulator